MNSLRTTSAQATLGRLGGELDLATAPYVAAYLERLVHPGTHLMLDLSEVTFMDCAGLAPILAAHERAALGGGWVLLRHVPRGPLMVVRLTGTWHLLDVGG